MRPLQLRPSTRQVLSERHKVLTEVLHDGVNLAVWQRRLAPQVADFVELLLAQPLEVAESLQIEIDADETLRMPSLLASQADLQGREAFIADVTWLIEAFACLLNARRIGLRLRSLAKPMCPRFHIDHVPLRLITTYAGVASEWLRASWTDAGWAMPNCPVRSPKEGSEVRARGELRFPRCDNYLVCRRR